MFRLTRGAATAVVLLLLAPVARAMPVTYSGTGTIETAYSYYHSTPGWGPLYDFAVGETVHVEVTYELTPYNNPGYVPVWFFASTSGGGYVSIVPDDAIGGQGYVTEVDGVLRAINTVDGTGSVYIFPDAGGGDGEVLVNFGRDDGTGSVGHGFSTHLTLARSPADLPFPAPEPSTLAMGLVGVGLVGLARWRRRSGRKGAMVLATIVVAALAVPASAQEMSPERQEALSRVAARRQAVQVRKARTRAYRAAQEAEAARDQRAHELRMAPVVAKVQADRMAASLVADRNRAEYLKAQAQFVQAEMMRRQAAAIAYEAWVLSGRRSVYP